MAKSSKKKPAKRKKRPKAKAHPRKVKAVRRKGTKAVARRKRRAVRQKPVRRTAAKRKATPKRKAVLRKKAGARTLVKRAPAARRVAAPAGIRAAPAAPVDDLRARVAAALELRGFVPPDETAIDVLTAIGRGYRMGPASPPAWLEVDVNGPIADGVAERFAIGDRARDIDRSTHRTTTGATVDIVLDQMAPDVGPGEREVLAAFSLGSWDPQVDTNAERNGIAGFVMAWYLAGR